MYNCSDLTGIPEPEYALLYYSYEGTLRDGNKTSNEGYCIVTGPTKAALRELSEHNVCSGGCEAPDDL